MYKKNRRTENGDAAINYASYFIVIIVISILYAYLTFQSGLLIVEQDLENGLMLAESAALSTNQRNGTGEDRTDLFERELNRLKIITVSDWDYGDSLTSNESTQVAHVGQQLSQYLKDQLGLVADASGHRVLPFQTTLAELCGDNARIELLDEDDYPNTDVVIYEPIYRITFQQQNGSNHVIYDTESGAFLQSSNIQGFTPEYHIDHWIAYHLKFANNEYASCRKERLFSTPILQNGDVCEGATIEATIGVQLTGLKNIFAGVSQETPIISDQGIQFRGSDSPLFAEEPRIEGAHYVRVTQSVDIVNATTDQRKQ